MPAKAQHVRESKASRLAAEAERRARRAAARRAEEEADRALVAEARAEGGDPIPLEEIKRRHGL